MLRLALLAALAVPPHAELVPLGDRVWAAVRREPLGLAQNANSLVVAGDSAVLVVDAQFTREATLETIALVRAATPLPVRWIVNTHWHDDHVAGNQVWRDAFPGVLVAMHASTRADLLGVARANRAGELAGGPAAMDRVERLLAAGLGVDSAGPASASEAAAMRNALRIHRAYVAEAPGFRETFDGLVVHERATIDLGGRTVELRWLGRGATRGDLVVHVPDAGVVAAGDLVVHPVPFAFSAHPGDWIRALDAIAALRPRAIVPGHGPVLRDLAFLQATRSALVAVRDAAQAGVARGDSLAAITAALSLRDARRAMAGDDAWHGWMFERYFRRPAIARAVREARAMRGALDTTAYAISNVNVVPMTGDTVLRAHTVVVRDGRIASVAPAGDADVAGLRTIDGAGRWLAPGLADMHTHLFSDGEEVHDSAGPAELGVMLANGVTAARLMIGTPEQLALRAGVRDGTIPGPQLWLASPHLAGRAFDHNAIAVTTPDAARAAVRQVAGAGYDFVKITLFVERPVYDAIVDEARRRGIRVVGHVDPLVGIARALETGQQLEHLDSYLEAALAESAPSRTSLTQQHVFPPANWASMDHVSDARLDSLAGATARAGAWIGPTNHVFTSAFAIGPTMDEVRARPDWDYWPPETRAGYARAHASYWAPATAAQRTPARRARYVAARDRLLKAMHDSGVRIIAGSDTPEWFNAYGFALPRELQSYVRAGLTPYQALRTATVNPAAWLQAGDEWGTIEPGKRADLVLLHADPLDDVAHLAEIDAVAIGGRWLDRAALDALLARGRNAIGAGVAPPPR